MNDSNGQAFFLEDTYLGVINVFNLLVPFLISIFGEMNSFSLF